VIAGRFAAATSSSLVRTALAGLAGPWRAVVVVAVAAVGVGRMAVGQEVGTVGA
jgi:hypothetical protein